MVGIATTIIPSIAPETYAWPGAIFWSSGRRAQDSRFDVEEKRAILPSWASESCAVKYPCLQARKDRSMIRVKERAPRPSRLEQVANHSDDQHETSDSIGTCNIALQRAGR